MAEFKEIQDILGNAFKSDLPEYTSMNEYLDWLIPQIRPLGEDLYEEKHYVGRPWLEFQDNDFFHDTVLHFFNEGGEYLYSVNGNVSIGHWRVLDGTNKVLIDNKERSAEAELYDLAYMDRNFFVLKKHGGAQHGRGSSYFVMANEGISRKLEWRDLMELMYSQYRSNNQFYFVLSVGVLLVIALIILLSTR